MSSVVHDLVERGQKIADRIGDEARTATRSWTLIEAYNGRDESHRESLRTCLSSAGLGLTINVIIKALARDTLGALFRATDEKGTSRETLCAITSLLRRPDAEARIHEYIVAQAPDFLRQTKLDEAKRAAQQVLEYVPQTWREPPQVAELHDIRERLRPIRDSLLAHSLDHSNVQQSSFGETRTFLNLVNELQHAASLAFYASTESLQGRWDYALKQAHRFWDTVERGAAPP